MGLCLSAGLDFVASLKWLTKGRFCFENPFIDELRNFPFGTYKDQVDAASQAYSRLTGMQEVERIT